MNRSQADINKNMDMMAARRNESEYFATSPDYGHLASKMGSEYLAKLLSKVQFCTSAAIDMHTQIWFELTFLVTYLSAFRICNQVKNSKYNFFDQQKYR